MGKFAFFISFILFGFPFFSLGQGSFSFEKGFSVSGSASFIPYYDENLDSVFSGDVHFNYSYLRDQIKIQPYASLNFLNLKFIDSGLSAGVLTEYFFKKRQAIKKISPSVGLDIRLFHPFLFWMDSKDLSPENKTGDKELDQLANILIGKVLDRHVNKWVNKVNKKLANTPWGQYPVGLIVGVPFVVKYFVTERTALSFLAEPALSLGGINSEENNDGLLSVLSLRVQIGFYHYPVL